MRRTRANDTEGVDLPKLEHMSSESFPKNNPVKSHEWWANIGLEPNGHFTNKTLQRTDKTSLLCEGRQYCAWTQISKYFFWSIQAQGIILLLILILYQSWRLFFSSWSFIFKNSTFISQLYILSFARQWTWNLVSRMGYNSWPRRHCFPHQWKGRIRS